MTRALTRSSSRCRFRGRERFSSTSDACTACMTGSEWLKFYDYVDGNVLMLARMYGRRLQGYSDMGYKILADSQQRLNI